MGWLFCEDSKQDLVKRFQAPDFYSEGYKALKHRLVGNQHWSLVEAPDGRKFITLEIISSSGGQWGYKGMDESVGPAYYDCPVSFLNEADEPRNEFASQWREKVMAKKARPAYASGQVWNIYGKEYELTESAGKRKGWLGILSTTGEMFRIPFAHLSKAELVA